MNQSLESASVGGTQLTRSELVRWWETRRAEFNAYLLCVCLVSFLLVLTAGGASVAQGEDFEEPFGLIAVPALLIGVANVCYTFGWAVDVIAYRGKPRERVFKAGLGFAILFAGLPGLWALAAFLIFKLTGRPLS